MGGIVFILAIVITTFVMTGKYSDPGPETYLMILVTVGFGLLGFLDDFIKVVMKRNLGLTSKQKLLGQIVISVIFILFSSRMIFRRPYPSHLPTFRLSWAGFIVCSLSFGLLDSRMQST